MTDTSGRTGLAQARGARPVSAEIEQEHAAARLRFELGETVRGRRLELGLSQGEAGRRARMTQSAVARFEAGGTVPTLPVPARLAEALDLDLRVDLTPHAESAQAAAPPGRRRSWKAPGPARAARCGAGGPRGRGEAPVGGCRVRQRR
ncbi:helix-turn-helix domain-containing protein [Streptomyces sp. SS8]